MPFYTDSTATYYLSPRPTSFRHALDTCQMIGATLVSFTSADKQNRVINALQAAKESAATTSVVWMGVVNDRGPNPITGQPKGWRWLDGSPWGK